MFDWTYSGVDHSLPGNGGEDCVNFIPPFQGIVETTFFTLLGLAYVYISWPHVGLPDKLPTSDRYGRFGKHFLLFLMTLTFGIEVGFKLATRQLIWIMNPCHIVSMVQIYLLLAPPSKTSMVVYRLHLHCLSGAVIAILLPVVNTRLLPFETEVYFIQHILMLVIPYYLMRVGGVYTPEPLTNMWWPLCAMGGLFAWHWFPLHMLARVSQVNLNNMMCPAVSDPFYGRWYRVCAAGHQHVLLMLHGKLYTWIAQHFLPARRPDSVHAMGTTQEVIANGDVPHKNGHTKVT